MVAGGVVAALMFAPSLVLATRLADPAQRATAMGGFHLAGSLGFMLGPMVGVGTLSGLRALGLEPYPGVFLLVGGLEVLCVLVCLPWLMRLRRTTATKAVPEDVFLR
jgi:predicted MFS family arabinose efflux permease